MFIYGAALGTDIVVIGRRALVGSDLRSVPIDVDVAAAGPYQVYMVLALVSVSTGAEAQGGHRIGGAGGDPG